MGVDGEPLQYKLSGFSRFRQATLFYILFPEEELAIEVGEVDGVKVEESDIAKASEDDVLHCGGLRHTGTSHWHRGTEVNQLVRVHSIVHAQSSQPIPPAPTRRTFVCERRLNRSAPRMAFACSDRPLIVYQVFRRYKGVADGR